MYHLILYILYVHVPGKLVSSRHSKQVSVGGIDEYRVQSHTTTLLILHYKNPIACVYVCVCVHVCVCVCVDELCGLAIKVYT